MRVRPLLLDSAFTGPGEYSSSCVISLQALAHIAILIMEIYGQCVLYEVFFVHAQGRGDISDDSIPTYALKV